MRTKIKFTKMHGLGNDYIYIDSQRYNITNPNALAIALSNRHSGIGGDGLVLIGSSNVAQFSMRIFNADGSEALMCGNALRCIGKYVYDKGLSNDTHISVETLSGIKHLNLHIKDQFVESVTVDMGIPLLRNKEQVNNHNGELIDADFSTEDGQTIKGTYVCMGNPHMVFFVDDINSFDLARFGQQIENLSLFPLRTNVEIASVSNDGCIEMRVWERGSGETQACGTGACATLVAAHTTNRIGNSAMVKMKGGKLNIEWLSDNHIYMTGEAVSIFDGEIEY